MGSGKRKVQPFEVIKLGSRAHPFLLVLVALSGGVAVTTGGLFFTNELPIYAKVPLSAVVILSAIFCYISIRQLGDTTITLGPSALDVVGSEGTHSFAWGKIEAVRVVGATGCLSDDPFSAIEKRIGLAVFLKGTKEGRTEVSEADAIIAVSDIEQGERLVEVSNSITRAMQKRASGGGNRPPAPRRLGEGRVKRPVARASRAAQA